MLRSIPPGDRKEFGNRAETIASTYLEGKKYTILKRNYRKPWGEIDIIAKQDETIVFVEVKANAKDFAGDFNPEVRVDERKINKIIKTATLYLQYELKNMNCEWRIDIISVTMEQEKAKITHFKNVAEDLY